MDKKEHWENVFAHKKQNEVSWFQTTPKLSIDFFEENTIHLEANIIDVGSGDSYFIDYLIDKGYKNIYALDISEKALQRLKNRLGANANKVNWIVSDILEFDIDIKFDYWHDRAVFHFLVNDIDINKYIEIVNRSIAVNGSMMIATFADNSPLKCSGLEIKQYSEQSLEQCFSTYFKKKKYVDELHPTPFNTNQHFTFCSFKRN